SPSPSDRKQQRRAGSLPSPRRSQSSPRPFFRRLEAGPGPAERSPPELHRHSPPPPASLGPHTPRKLFPGGRSYKPLTPRDSCEEIPNPWEQRPWFESSARHLDISESLGTLLLELHAVYECANRVLSSVERGFQ